MQTISEQLYGISRCKYDLCQGQGFTDYRCLSSILNNCGVKNPLRKAGAEADDTIYVTEKILGKFYPSREDKSEANTKNMIEDLLKKLSGRRYYEEIENNRIQKENEIFNRHVTISERIDKILKIKKSVTRPVFDVKQILKKP